MEAFISKSKMRPSEILGVENNVSKEKKEKPELELGKIRKTWVSVAENSCWQIADTTDRKEASDILWPILNVIEIEAIENKL